MNMRAYVTSITVLDVNSENDVATTTISVPLNDASLYTITNILHAQSRTLNRASERQLTFDVGLSMESFS